MKSKQTASELIIQETPGCLWLFGLFFAVVGGIFVYGALGGLVDYGSQPIWVLATAFVMGSIAVGVGVWIIYRAPLSKLVFDRIDKTLIYTTYGLAGKRETVYDFDEIVAFRLIEERDSEGDPIWSLGMNLADGETIKISSLASHAENFKRDLVFQANEFMYKQMPAAADVFELEDESVDEMS
jgi:hypothetical protein